MALSLSLSMSFGAWLSAYRELNGCVGMVFAASKMARLHERDPEQAPLGLNFAN